MTSGTSRGTVSKIQEYWNERARSQAASGQATTNDIYLRELELRAFAGMLKKLSLSAGVLVLDAGCGDGETTLRLAEQLPSLSFEGVDYAAGMVEAAHHRLQGGAARGNVKFQQGDVMKLCEIFSERLFDVVLTDRCLINLETEADQAVAMASLAAVLRPGGWYIAVENFMEGQDNMNAARRGAGLQDIPVRWHNLFFTESSFRKAANPWFEAPEFHDFASSYYLVTRVAYAASCRLRGVAPDYRDPIHQSAVDLPVTGCFSPVRMAVLKRKEMQ